MPKTIFMIFHILFIVSLYFFAYINLKDKLNKEGRTKKFFAILIMSSFLFSCVAHVTPEGTYLEPLPATVVIGAPVIVQPPPHIIVQPLPPVVLHPERPIYFYSNIYYYQYGGKWYYSKDKKGPWHKLHKKYYPPRSKKY
jgi:hypothetical protein